MADIRSATPELQFLLVGAAASDLLLFRTHGIKTGRATEDVDLALAVADWNEFQKARDLLLGTDHFKPAPRVAHKVFYIPQLAFIKKKPRRFIHRNSGPLLA